MPYLFFNVYLTYIDESGKPDLSDPENVFVLSPFTINKGIG